LVSHSQCKNNIYLVSRLNDNVVKDMMITPIHTVEEGLQRAFEALGKDAQVAAIPEGPLVLGLLKH
jgi:nickel-dependent lactate racemase